MAVHHSTGVPMGTGAMIPFMTSSSKPFFTASFKLNGMGMGVCFTCGFASELMCMWAGLVFIIGNGPSLLNVVFENLSNKYCLRFGILASVGANGIVSGRHGDMDGLVSTEEILTG